LPCLSLPPFPPPPVAEDGKTGVIAVGDGLGYNCRRTTDGGATWETVPSQDGYIFGLNGAAAAGTSAVAIGDLATQFSLNSGTYFNSSLLGGPGGGVYARTFYTPSEGFVQIGVFTDNTNGLNTSPDGGLSWTKSDASNALNETGAVGAACQPGGIWYVVGADGPQQVAADLENDPSVARIMRPVRNGRIAVVVRKDGSTETVTRQPNTAPGLGDPYRAQLAKSTDGGKTWNLLHFEHGRYFYQGIDCSDAAGQNCCMVGEADSGDFAGAYIRCFHDGGVNLTINYNDTTLGASLIDIRAVSATEWWAVGGIITQSTISAYWLHSVDGGNSWTLDTRMDNYYTTSINCNAGGCFSSVIDGNENSYIAKQGASAATTKLRGSQ
jgi:hypothetical protein